MRTPHQTQMFAVSLNKHWKHGGSAPLWVSNTHTEAMLLYVISCEACLTVEQGGEKQSLVACLHKCLHPHTPLLVLLQLDPPKTKGHFTHKNVLMLHDQATKEGK